jgi:hypothetical protein
MKKITLLLFLLTASFGFSQEFPLDFEDVADDNWFAFNGASVSVIDDSGNNVLQIVGNGGNDDGVGSALAVGVGLSDPNNNTITLKVNPVGVGAGEVRNHLLKFEAPCCVELPFSTTGSGWQDIAINFGSGLTTYSTIVIFPSFNEAFSESYLIDDIAVGPDPAPTCTDGVQNGDETGVDCGGSCPDACPEPTTSFSDDFEDGLPGGYSVGGDAGTFSVIDNPDFSGRSTSAKVGQLAGINTQLYTHVEKTFATALDMSTMDRGFSMWVKGSSAIPVGFKIQINDGSFAGELVTVNYTDVGNWQKLLFDFTANNTTNRDQVIIFFDIENSTDVPGGTFLFDDVTMAAFSTLGTNSFVNTSFNVSPNPSNTIWNVKTKDQIINTVQVFDVLGKEVLNMSPNKADVEIEASILPKGLYFAKMTTEFGSNSIKLIKN